MHQLAERQPDQQYCNAQDMQRQQRLVTGAEVAGGDHAGQHRQEGHDPAEPVIKRRNDALRRVGKAHHQGGDQRDQRDDADGVNHVVGQ